MLPYLSLLLWNSLSQPTCRRLLMLLLSTRCWERVRLGGQLPTMLSVGAATGCWCCHWGRAVPAAPTPAAPTLHGVVTRSGMALAPSLVTINLSLRCLKSVAAIGWGPIYRIGLIRIYCFAVFLIEALSYNGLHTMQKVLAPTSPTTRTSDDTLQDLIFLDDSEGSCLPCLVLVLPLGVGAATGGARSRRHPHRRHPHCMVW